MALYPLLVSNGNFALHKDQTAQKWLLVATVIIGGTILIGLVTSMIVRSVRKSGAAPETSGEVLLDEAVKRRRETGGHGGQPGDISPEESEKEKRDPGG